MQNPRLRRRAQSQEVKYLKIGLLAAILLCVGFAYFAVSSGPDNQRFQEHICNEAARGIKFRCNEDSIDDHTCNKVVFSMMHTCMGALPPE